MEKVELICDFCEQPFILGQKMVKYVHKTSLMLLVFIIHGTCEQEFKEKWKDLF